MRHLILAAACLAALSGCSKPNEAADEKAAQPDAAPSQAEAAESQGDDAAENAKSAAFLKAVKVDIAALTVATASEACSGFKGSEAPDPKTGAPMQFTAAGVISWGKGSFNYVNEPGVNLNIMSGRTEKTFAFGAEIYQLPQGNRTYVVGLSQLKGASLSATVTDETKAVDGNTDQTTSNLCVGSVAPPIATQGAWSIAAKHLRVPSTEMTCMLPGKPELQTLKFAFDGKVITAGPHAFTEADSAYSEILQIDASGGTAKVVYSVAKAGGLGVQLGLSQPNVLTYAAIDLPDAGRMMCAAK